MDPLRRQVTDPTAEKLFLMAERLRALDREFPAQALATLFYIASRDKCHKQALEEDLDFSTASGSRNTSLLSDLHRFNRPGLNLIVREKDPGNGRRLQLRLTDKGQFLIDQLKEILYD